MSVTGSILTLNAGSSSLKFAIFDGTTSLKATARGEIEDLDAAPRLLTRHHPLSRIAPFHEGGGHDFRKPQYFPSR
jgi:acetate kinase